MNALDAIWSEVSQKLYITREEFNRNMEGWDIEEVRADGVLMGLWLEKGPMFHIMSFGTGHPITMKMARERLQKLIDRHGYAETRTPRDDERQHRFNRKFGFNQVGEDEYDIHYRIERLRGGKCLSSP